MTFLPSKGARCLQGLDRQDPPRSHGRGLPRSCEPRSPAGVRPRGCLHLAIHTGPGLPGGVCYEATLCLHVMRDSTHKSRPTDNGQRSTTNTYRRKKGGNVFYSPTLPKPGKAKPCGCWCWWEESSRTLQDGHGEAGSTAVVWGAGHTTTCHLSDMQITLS